MDRVTVAPFIVAFLAGLAIMPALNIFRVCAWNVGTMKVDPWRIRGGRAIQRIAQTLRTWFASLFTSRRVAFACLAVLIALLATQLSSGHAYAHQLHVLTATAIPVATLRENRSKLLQRAEALIKDGKFESEATRKEAAGFLDEAEALDVQIRLAEAAEPKPGAEPKPAVDQRDATTIERERCAGIRQVARAAKLEDVDVFVDKHIKDGTTLDAVRKLVLDELATRDGAKPSTDGNLRVEVGEGSRDKFLRGAEMWLVRKAGVADLVAKHTKTTVDKLDPGEFRGMSLIDIGRECLERAGVKTRGMDRMRVAAMALTHRNAGMQSMGDFATLLENTMHKVLQAAYGTTPDTWSRFCKRSTNVDFRASNRYRLGQFGALDALTATGEFKNKPILDAEKASITLATKGNIIGLNRQAIVNDDMNAFNRLATMLGRAGKLSIEVDVYALLAQNANLGPTMSDSLPLFDAGHGNIGTGAAISVASIDADRVLMARQKEPNGNEYIDLRPKRLLVPVELGGTARVINGAPYDPDTANKLQRPNMVHSLYDDIIDTPRISGTRRYSFADPDIAPVLEVAFLDGQEEPVLESQDGWRVDGVEWKVRLDYGVGATDYRGATTNAGV